MLEIRNQSDLTENHIKRKAAGYQRLSSNWLWLLMATYKPSFPIQNVKLNHYIAVFERVVLLCKICEQQTSNRIESLAIESGCIRG